MIFPTLSLVSEDSAAGAADILKITVIHIMVMTSKITVFLFNFILLSIHLKNVLKHFTIPQGNKQALSLN